MAASSPFALDNPVFRVYLAYAVLNVVKIFGLNLLVAYYRVSRNVFANPEDAKMVGVKSTISNDDKVERCRRAVLNDLENVIPSMFLGLLYVCTGPTLWAATLHFRLYTVFRFLHSVVYVGAFPQPSRSLLHLFALIVAFSMAFAVFNASTL